jgi:signal transduction histidine kinase
MHKYFSTILSLFVLLFIIVLVVVTSYILYNQTSEILNENLRQRLLSISITAAANIDANDLKELRVESDWQKPEWTKIVKSLHASKYSNDDVVYMYIFRYTPNPTDDPIDMEFVVDADSINPYVNMGTDTSKYVDVNRDGKVEPDGPDKLQWPGQMYPEAVDIPETKASYNGPLTAAELYTDDYGTVLTGYAPIKDSNGKTVAVLATDIKADDFFTITSQTLSPFLIFISFLSFIITILILILIFSWRNNSKTLEIANKKIASQKSTLEELLKVKEETLHLVNHQLNTPVSIIKSSISMFQDKLWDEAKFINVINTEANRMSETVAQFLSAKKAEDKNMVLNKTNTDLGTLVKTLIDEKRLLKKVRDTNINIRFKEVENLPIVNCDVSKITEVISNLLDNAISYSSNDIDVAVVVKEKNVLLSVKDSGIGIKKELLDKLFQRFTRLENAKKTRPDGTGLGLYVCKQMVEAHSGKIWVESDGEKKGSTFFVSLPL